MKTHGHSGERSKGIGPKPTYNVWQKMKDRCSNKNCPDFHIYGGRGIRVCKRWMNYENFLEDMGEMPKGKSIDRINGNGNYEPSNCRWATPKEQARNTSRNVWITYNGRTQILQDWAKELGIKQPALHYRLKRYPVHIAFNAPINPRKRVSL